MRLRRAILEELELPLRAPFVTSFGRESRRRVLFVTLEERGGEEGIGECVAARAPLYSSETTWTAREMIGRHFLKDLRSLATPTPGRFLAASSRWRGHRMARAAVEMALWDLTARLRGQSLARTLGGTLDRVEVGVSVGIQPGIAALRRAVERYVTAGYGRVKLKVQPGWDARPVAAIRRAFPTARLWVDANQAFARGSIPQLVKWAHRERVEQMEQPFPERDLSAHAALIERARFRVCLDESVVDSASLEDAIARRALTSLNVKPGRVGGHSHSIALARRAVAAGIPTWVGGMLETGVGRAHAVALASRKEFTLPADLSASDRYYRTDLIDPPFVLGAGSTLEVPRSPGLGVAVDERRWARARRWRTVVPL